jgi:hypothetical protein
MKTRMLLKKPVDGFPFMPSGPIHIEPDRKAPEVATQMTQDFHKAFPIPSGGADKPISSQKRRHPARKIKPLAMLACGRDAKRMSSLCPSPSQPRMQGKAGLILEDNRFPRTQILKFFLTRGETASSLPPGLGDTHNWPALGDIPADASISGLAALSVSPRTGALGVRPESGRPNGLGLGRTPAAIALNGARLLEQSEPLIGKAALVSVCSSRLSTLRRLPPEPNGSGSFALGLRPGRSSRVAVPRRSEEDRRSSTPAKPRGYSWPRPPGFPESPPDDRCLWAPYRQFSINWPKL